jgi:hypothetical protein
MALILSGGTGGNSTITGHSGNLTISDAANIFTGSAAVSTTGNITASYILGNGSLLTGVATSGGATWANVQTANLTAVSGNAYPINTTSAAIYVTLPASPSAGNSIQLTDYARTWNANSVTLNPNGNKIQGSTSNVILNISGQSVSLVYVDSTQGWLASFNSVTQLVNYTVTYLVVAGGGGGASGGGGAGGLIYNTYSVSAGQSYGITVGGGGSSGTSGINGTNGNNSSFSSIAVAVGGGYGVKTDTIGGAGGSGGGAGANGGSVLAGGSGTAGQGNNGGTNGVIPSPYPAGGGGGAGAVGSNGSGSTGGAGGAGLTYTISGSSTTYAGGGGGGVYFAGTGGASGSGGGGSGGTNTGSGTAGSVNTGGGGGGGGVSGTGGAGGSGIVIISYTGAQRGTGGTITTASGNTIHTFTSSGTFVA